MKEWSMLAFEALTQAPKAAILASSGENAAEAQGVSFEEFLKGIAKHSILLTPKGDVIPSPKEQNTSSQPISDPKSMLLSLLQSDEDTKTTNKENLLELLKNDDTDIQEEFTLNPALTQDLSVNELKYLLHKAKQYLKTKILQAEPQLTKQELPKSLKGLLQLADKLKIEIKKISFEHIVADEKSQKPESLKIKPSLETNRASAKKEHTKKAAVTTKVEHEVEMLDEESMKIKTIETKIESIKDTPLFQAKSRSVDIRHIVTTSQLMESKNKKDLPKKEQNTDLLHSLLKSSGKTTSESQKESLFSAIEGKIEKSAHNMHAILDENKVSKAKKTEPNSFNRTLEELLHTDSASSEIKPQTHKSADALDVKIHEAKQMMKYLSQDIKKAIEEYKPPFSRVKVKLNPQRLGEMDLTVVQRGKNVHINLSSNNAALNVLTNNLHELRTQLNQNGINNATFNFNSDAQNQQQKQKEQDRRHEYEFFANDEENEEQSRSLEIIVPRYI